MLDADVSIEELREIEASCLAKLRARAEMIHAASPGLSRQICFGRAIEEMPRTVVKYQHVRSRLGLAGVAALPLLK